LKKRRSTEREKKGIQTIYYRVRPERLRNNRRIQHRVKGRIKSTSGKEGGREEAAHFRGSYAKGRGFEGKQGSGGKALN